MMLPQEEIPRKDVPRNGKVGPVKHAFIVQRFAVRGWPILVVVGALLLVSGLAIVVLGLVGNQSGMLQTSVRRPPSARPLENLPVSAPLRLTPTASTPVPSEPSTSDALGLPGRAGQPVPWFLAQQEPPDAEPPAPGPAGRGAAAPYGASIDMMPSAARRRTHETAVWMIIPRLQVDSPVVEVNVEGGYYQVPPYEVGHHFDTPNPGETGNAIFTGHVSHLVYGRVFARLGELEPGDLLYLYGEESETVWQIVERRIVTARDSSILTQWRGPHVTIYTCTGTFDWLAQDYSHRLALIAVPYS